MFKKPLSNLKTSAPLRSSDRRKLKQKVAEAFILTAEIAEILVPEGLLSIKFVTHLNELGVAYLAPGNDGDPLWFTIGKGSEILIPTVYTLWKHAELIPTLYTPPAVIPVLCGGADLMIPGVAHPMNIPSTLVAGQLVAVAEYVPGARGTPLAVGTLAVEASELSKGGKGKAVHVLHVWKDHLWLLGNKRDPPEPEPERREDEGRSEDVAVTPSTGQGGEPEGERKDESTWERLTTPISKTPLSQEDLAQLPSAQKHSPQEITAILRSSLIQAISTTIAALPASSFPLSTTTFYSAHILPARPRTAAQSPTPIDIKNSTFKNLAAFLKAMEKEGLLKFKDVRNGEPLVLSVVKDHPAVLGHKSYVTLKDVENQHAKRAAREEKERNQVADIVVLELWKPHLKSLAFFIEANKDTSGLYTLTDIRELVNDYIAEKTLVNPHDQKYVNLDPVLQDIFSSKSQENTTEFAKRDEIAVKLVEQMQAWHEVTIAGKEPTRRKGGLAAIAVVEKRRQGKRAVTTIVGFENFMLDADELADELQKVCASATSVAQLPGKSGGLEVSVQGKQAKSVQTLLRARGVPVKWIKLTELGGK